MIFHSYSFIYIFLPVFLLGIYLIQKFSLGNSKEKYIIRGWIILASCVFFVSYGRTACFALFISILWNVVFGRLITKKHVFRIPGILGNVLFLCFFKYNGSILMPIAVSFYTFQQIAYLEGLYRKEIERFDLTEYLSYILFFPKLLQGPLCDYNKITGQIDRLKDRKISADNVLEGLFLFTLGLAKKVIISDVLAKGADYGYQSLASLTAIDAIITALCYSLQLYFDFSGYCDMAEGICRMMGMELEINFHSPYKAEDIAGFWDRWHITLTRFFTKYVYIPLGGSRKGTVRTYINILTVFFLSGLWHGAGWTFVIWGMLHGVMMVLVRMCKEASRKDKRTKALENNAATKLICGIKVLMTFLYVTLAWVFFRADTASDAVSLLRRIVTPSAWEGHHVSIKLAECFQMDELWYVLKVTPIATMKYGGFLCMWIILAISLFMVFFAKEARQLACDMKGRARYTLVMALLFVWCTLSLGGVSTFLYVNF